MAKRAYKYRFYPTKEQEIYLAKTFGCVRFVYNYVLAWRQEQYQKGVRVSFAEASRKVTEIKHLEEFEWLKEVSADALFQSIRNQQTAYKNFFNKTARFPKFKSKHDRQSFRLPPCMIRIKDGRLYLPKRADALKIKWTSELPCKPISMTISKDCAGRYFVSFMCEADTENLPVSKKTVGVDLGIKDLAITDSGEIFSNPKHTNKYANRLAKAQRRLSKKKLGSANRQKAKKKVARIHAKISDCRRDNLHKVSRKLVNENQVICVESLKVKNMVRNRKLSKAISDCGWGELVRQLEYKSEWAGRSLVKIDAFFPSTKSCSECGQIVDKIPLSVREWDCPGCGAHHDRDINAAKNIKAVGHTVLSRGENVSRAA